MNRCDEFLCTTIAFLTFITICIGITNMVEMVRCDQVGKTLNYKTEWHYWTGCVVEKPSGEKVLLRQLRDFTGVENEQKR